MVSDNVNIFALLLNVIYSPVISLTPTRKVFRKPVLCNYRSRRHNGKCDCELYSSPLFFLNSNRVISKSYIGLPTDRLPILWISFIRRTPERLSHVESEGIAPIERMFEVAKTLR